MKKTFIKELTDGEKVSDQFVVIDKIKEKAKSGRTYITVKLADKTGRISGKIWDNVDKNYELFDRGDVVFIDGTASVYRGALEVHISSIRRCSEEEFDRSDFLPISEKDRKKMFNKLLSIIDSLQNDYLKTLLKNIFSNKEIKNAIMKMPGSVNIHHAYVGGLLEHTLNVAEICDKVAELYPMLDRDILISGALLHDIGKIKEYDVSGTIQQTNQGKLIGHISIGIAMVQKEIDKIENFPEELSIAILHLIVSHHGEYEFGSPKLPQTPEAAALAYADLLDSKVESFISIVKKTDEEWSSYVSLLNRRIYTGKKNSD